MIRKQNSELITAFTSEATKNVNNTDCFAYVELDGLACYVVADGIDDLLHEESARICVDTVIAAFTESPSMSKKAMKRYVSVANTKLLGYKSKNKLKASIMIVVHNYAKMRFAQAGNVRFQLYRNGFIKRQSIDQSMTMDLLKENKITKDKVQTHQERHNLYTYLGQEKDFKPFVSEKIKMTNTDAFAIYTRGIWESLDEGELADLFADAGEKPQDTVDTAEDMVLSKLPDTLEKYTFVTVFVNKTFTDPNKKRKIKKIIITTIIVLIVVLIISLIIYSFYRKKQNNIALMNESLQITISSMEANNFVRAKEACQETISLAKTVKDEVVKTDAYDYLTLIEGILFAEDFLATENYISAEEGYLNALEYARFADGYATEYINNRLLLTSNYIQVYELLSLGDTLVLNSQYDAAELKYIEAQLLASSIYFDKGRENAKAGLEVVYAYKEAGAVAVEEKAMEVAEKALEVAATETMAIDFLLQGDTAFAEANYEAAKVFYNTAQQKYAELEDETNLQLVMEKIAVVDTIIYNIKIRTDEAVEYELKGDVAYAEKLYIQAKTYFNLAKGVYQGLANTDKVAELETKIVAMIEEEAAVTAFVLQGDEAVRIQNYDEAIIYYTNAKEAYATINDTMNADLMTSKIVGVNDIKMKIALKSGEAKTATEEAEVAYNNGDLELALELYVEAKTLYESVDKTDEVEAVEKLISSVENELAEE